MKVIDGYRRPYSCNVGSFLLCALKYSGVCHVYLSGKHNLLKISIAHFVRLGEQSTD